MTDKGKKMIKKLLDDGLLAIENEKDTDLISSEQAQKESEKDIVKKSDGKSILDREEGNI